MGFFTRALDKITPWRRGGEVQRDQQSAQAKRKKRQDEEDRSSGLSAGIKRLGQNIVAENQQQLQKPLPQRPENLFAGLNNNLNIGQPQNSILVQKNQDSLLPPTPQPGEVVKPTTLNVLNSASKLNITLPDGRKASDIPDTPEMIINRGLDRGKSWEQIAKENNYKLEGVREYSQSTRPNYGIKIERPKQGFWNKGRDIFDANTEADKYRRQEGNKYRPLGVEEKPLNLVNPGNIVSRTPIVGHVTKTLNTLGTQGAQLIPTAGGALATQEYSAATKEYMIAQKSGNKARIAKAKERVGKAADRVSDYNDQQEASSTMFEKNKGGLFNAGTLYDEEASKSGDIKTGLKDIVLPTAVSMLDVYTLGKGSAISNSVSQQGLKAGVRTAAPNIVKAGAGNFASGAGSSVSEGGNAEQAIKSGLINSILGMVPDIGLPVVGKAVKNRILPKSGSRVLPSANRPAGEIQLAIEKAHNAGDPAEVVRLIDTLPPDMQASMKSALGLTPQRHLRMDSTGKLIDDSAAASPPLPPSPPPKPSLVQRVLNRFRAEDIVGTSDNASASFAAETANQAMRPRPISIAQDIPVQGVEGLSQPVRVRNLNEPKPLIREFPGDASVATPNALIQKTADDSYAEAVRNAAFEQAQTAPRPDSAIEGVTPRINPVYNLDEATIKTVQDKAIDDYASLLRQVGEGNGVDILPDGRRVSNNVRLGDTGGKRMSQAAWREEAERQLLEGKADPSIQKVFDEAADPEVQALLFKGEQPIAPEGRPIVVKQATGIPVTDETVVPTGLPETPGTVRATTQVSPMAAKSEAVANAPVVARPAQLPAETQAILDNPKQFNKRQVAAARNQRKLARQMAKTTEQTAEAMDRIETVSPAAASPESYVATGEFGKSVNGGAYQKVSRAAEMSQAIEETANTSPGDILQTARTNQAATGGFNPRDMRNIRALAESKRILRGTPEYNELKTILKEDGTVWGQQGALRNYTMRRTASADELVNRYESKIYRLVDDPTKVESKWFDEVEAAENTYTQARDEAMATYNRFTESPTTANAKAYHAAQDAAEKADKAAKTTEYKVADKVLKGNKDVKQMRELEKMANEADLYQMDAVDASMLSGTGTFARNVANAAVGGLEEGLFGGLASRVTRLITRQNIGGGFGRGTLSGFGGGTKNIVDASKARAGNAGKNPLSHVKNWATTGNQLGDTIIDSQTKHNVLDHYTSVLKEQGYKGRELVDRASVMARQDPDNLGRMYAGAARTAAGLGAGVTRGNKIETFMKNLISDTISGGKPNKLTEGTAKLITRMTIGFPTAIGRSTAEGVKRFTLGAPTFIKAIRTADPVERALLVKEGIKQAGTGGMVIPPLFYAMGASGMITGSYPSDKEERARWEREGITENSVRIGDSYYQLPAYLGGWAAPGLFYASLGRNDGDFTAATADVAKIVPALLPTDQASNVLDWVNGRTDTGKFLSQTGASAVRAATPGGALLNQISKSIDPTKNDTTSGTNWENFIDKVVSGIPGQNVFADIPDKVDDAGNPIQNPGAVPLLFGAASAAQGAGEVRSVEIQGQVDNKIKALSDIGLLDDPNIDGVLEDKALESYNKIKSGKKYTEDDVKRVQEGLVKGVSSEGTDTAYLEREQYDTNLAVLKLKRDLMKTDKTVKPSSLKDIDMAIKRGEIYKKQEVPYEVISEYQKTSLSEWRKMGDPEDDEYNPDRYQKLWNMDQMMTKAGVSYKTDKPEENKYSAKKPGKGRGAGSRGGRASELGSDFGQLKAGDFAPSVQQYQTIDQKAGSVPIIRTVRPNIVHKIGSSG